MSLPSWYMLRVDGIAGGNVSRFNWLHLSDLHLGAGSSRLLRPEYREVFELDLRRLHERSGPWDLVIISGDLTATGSEREFGMLTSTLTSLWSFFRRLGSQPYLLAVPGDMDFQRSLFPKVPSLSASEAWKESQGAREDLARGLESFTQWFASWRLSHPAAAAFHEGLLPGDFAATVVKADLKVGILGLNTLLRNDPGIRELHIEQVSAAIGKDLRKWAQQHDLLMLVTHVAPFWLNAAALDRLQEELVPPGRPFLHLCGRRYNSRFRDTWTSTTIHPHRTICIQAPSLFSESCGPKAWGYASARLSFSEARAGFRLFPRVAVARDDSITVVPGSEKLGPDEALELPLEALFWGSPPESMGEGAAPLVPPSSPATTRLLERQVQTGALWSDFLPAGVKSQAMLDACRTPTGSVAVMRREVCGLVWSPAGDALAVGLSDGHLLFWKPEEQRPLWDARVHSSKVSDLCFSPDGQKLATVTDFNVRLWSSGGTAIQRAPFVVSERAVLAWSSSDLLASAGSGDLQIWDTRTPAQVSTLPFPFGPTPWRALAWSPDGQTLACGNKGGFHLTLWKQEAGAFASHLQTPAKGSGFPGAILALAWMPVSSRIALANQDGTILIWDTSKAERVATLEGDTSAVTSVSFSFDGRLLASKSQDGLVRLWRTDTWQQTARSGKAVASTHPKALAFSPTKPVLAVIGHGGRDVQVWEIDIEALS